MFQLFKQRNFNDLINDTFLFFRKSGKNYFRNYFIINGGFLLILVVLVYLVSKVFFDGLFTSFGTPKATELLEIFFQDNIAYFIISAIVAVVLILLLTMLSYSFPVIYLKLLEKNENPSTSQIIAGIKAKTGKIIIFALLSLVTFMPIAAISLFISGILIFLLIGLPLFVVVLAAITCWIFQSFYDYINNDTDYFTAMGNGYRMMTNKFWHNVGATAIFMLIVYIVHSIISFIPYIIGMVSMFSDMSQNGENTPDLSFFGIMMLVTIILSTLLSFVLTNLTIIGQGIIYYSNVEQQQNNSLHSDIDKIGSDFE